MDPCQGMEWSFPGQSVCVPLTGEEGWFGKGGGGVLDIPAVALFVFATVIWL